MNRFLNWFSGIFAVVFLIPSFLVMVSWNAIPGDASYGMKTGLEDVLLSLVSNSSFAPKVSASYTQRRYTEAIKLLDKKGSTVGYSLLVAEAKQTQDFVIENSDSESAEELIAKIDQYKSEIETKKVSIQSGRTSIPVASGSTGTTTKNKTGSPTKPQAPTTQPSSKTPTTDTKPNDVEVIIATSEEEVIEDLAGVQEELEEIKKEIEKKVPKNLKDSSSDKEKGSDKKKDDKGRGNIQEKDND